MAPLAFPILHYMNSDFDTVHHCSKKVAPSFFRFFYQAPPVVGRTNRQRGWQRASDRGDGVLSSGSSLEKRKKNLICGGKIVPTTLFER